MKKLIGFITFLLLFFYTADVSAQYSNRMNDKYDEYKRMQHRGIALTIIGTGLIIAGSYSLQTGLEKIKMEDDPESDVGYPEAVLGGLSLFTGAVCFIPGIIEWTIGNKKTKEYRLLIDKSRTGFYISPGYTGVKLAINF